MATQHKNTPDFNSLIELISKQVDEVVRIANEVAEVNNFLREENTRLRQIICSTRYDRMTVVKGGKNGN